MRAYLIKRIAQNVLVFFLFITFIFFLVDAQPGDYGNAFLNDPRLTAEQRQAIRAQMGLDRPTHERYLIWLGNFFQGDLGISFSNYPRSVLDVIKERAPRTLVLFLSATVVSFYMGFLSGKLLAWRRGGPFEYSATLGGVFLFTVFTPWFALMMIWIFAYRLDWFPIGKFIDPILWRNAPPDLTANTLFLQLILTAVLASVVLLLWLLAVQRLEPGRRLLAQWGGATVLGLLVTGYWAFFSGGAGVFALNILHHLFLPILTVALVSFAGTMLLTRNSMLETLREDYILTARAKGLPEAVIRDKHAARNALLPVVTSFIFSMATALDGGVITETIFSWPGMGLTLLNAAQTEDIPMAVGALVFTGGLVLVAHLCADIAYAYLDPRIRYS